MSAFKTMSLISDLEIPGWIHGWSLPDFFFFFVSELYKVSPNEMAL